MTILEGYLSREQLAAELNVTTRTLWRWQNEPDGLPYTRIGNQLYYRVESVRNWVAGRETKPNTRRRSA
ncbi:helix-turn-helix domain-containing protein [Rhizobium laguerreae]